MNDIDDIIMGGMVFKAGGGPKSLERNRQTDLLGTGWKCSLFSFFQFQTVPFLLKSFLSIAVCIFPGRGGKCRGARDCSSRVPYR